MKGACATTAGVAALVLALSYPLDRGFADQTNGLGFYLKTTVLSGIWRAAGVEVTDELLDITRSNHGWPYFFGPGTFEITKMTSVVVPKGSPKVRNMTFVFQHMRAGAVLNRIALRVKIRGNGKAKGGKADVPSLVFNEGDSLDVSLLLDQDLDVGTELAIDLTFVADAVVRSRPHGVAE